MKVVQLGVEFAPIAKVGGLGEVIQGLSRELTRQKVQVDVILPKYDFLDVRKLSKLKVEVPEFTCLGHTNAMWSATCEGCSLHLLESSTNYFRRGKIYGCEDDTARFLYFSRACLEYLKLKNEPIDILHLHDWHVAVCALLAKEIFSLPIKAILLTIHNGEHQGRSAPWDLEAIGLKKHDLLQDDDPAHPKALNLLKGGIVYADWVNTVSPTYAKELLTAAIGGPLSKTFRKYKDKLSGFLNGIDQTTWDPSNDPNLPKPYAASSPLPEILAAKEAARTALRKRFSLPLTHRPWVGSITRLVPQKGPELIEHGLRQTLALGGSFLLLGSSPLPKIQKHFDKLKQEFVGSPQALLHFEYDEELSHLLFAALDFLLVPSHFEPCGLTQLLAMRYGTLPIVRGTGGLKDTVFDEGAPHPQNGFVFRDLDPTALAATLQRAILLFQNEQEKCNALLIRDMRQDYSWTQLSKNYFNLFRNLTFT